MKVENIKNVVVIGTGVMGPDISIGFAMAGYDVKLVDIEQDILDQAAKRLTANCRQMVEAGVFDEKHAAAVKSRISLTLDWDKSVTTADYITEAVPEIMEIKQEVFKRCDDLCSQNVVIASNTSSMSITEIASRMRYPQRAICTHWIIPAHLSPAVEIVCGERTSTAVKDFVIRLLKKAGKTPVFCRDSPGFIHNYIQFAMVRAALSLLQGKIASAEDIDTVIRNGFGLRMSSVGPLQFVDMAGLDTILNIQQYMYAITKDPVYEPCEIIEEHVARGDLGVKSGKGFYDHSDNLDRLIEDRNRNMIKIMQVLKKD
jgi:3-hydroxybutyryl-CoA dehydrogenase